MIVWIRAFSSLMDALGFENVKPGPTLDGPPFCPPGGPLADTLELNAFVYSYAELGGWGLTWGCHAPVARLPSRARLSPGLDDRCATTAI